MIAGAPSAPHACLCILRSPGSTVRVTTGTEPRERMATPPGPLATPHGVTAGPLDCCGRKLGVGALSSCRQTMSGLAPFSHCTAVDVVDVERRTERHRQARASRVSGGQAVVLARPRVKRRGEQRNPQLGSGLSLHNLDAALDQIAPPRTITESCEAPTRILRMSRTGFAFRSK